ncbi:OmpA/MotB [Planoprotostelium fungivorum]|uniref:OmpA/MotB n=1 Tax=Planoprotostelium fungivorum TaxID=1890364 RepID=A0A2P6NCH8_9EUKA|nr:OmpA/MotB [Planoprotostelium fungivorum]
MPKFKTLVLDSTMKAGDCLPSIIEKVQSTSTSKFGDHVLFQSIDHGRVLIELEPEEIPFNIAQAWGDLSEDSNRLVFKKPGEPLKKGLVGFEKFSKKSEVKKEGRPRPQKSNSNLGPTPSGNLSNSSNSSDFNANYESSIIQQGQPPIRPAAPAPAPAPTPSYSAPSYSSPPSNEEQQGQNGNQSYGGQQGGYGGGASAPAGLRMGGVPMPGFGALGGPGGMDPNALQNRIKNMKEQQNVQIESVKAWVNTHLSNRGVEVYDLSEDMKNGVYLSMLAEALTGKSMRYNSEPKSNMQMKDNVQACFMAFENAGVRAAGCSPDDFLNGNTKAVVGYMLLLVKRFKNESRRASGKFSAALTANGATTSAPTGAAAPSRPPPSAQGGVAGRPPPSVKAAGAPPPFKSAGGLPMKASVGPPMKSSGGPPVKANGPPPRPAAAPPVPMGRGVPANAPPSRPSPPPNRPPISPPAIKASAGRGVVAPPVKVSAPTRPNVAPVKVAAPVVPSYQAPTYEESEPAYEESAQEYEETNLEDELDKISTMDFGLSSSSSKPSSRPGGHLLTPMLSESGTILPLPPPMDDTQAVDDWPEEPPTTQEPEVYDQEEYGQEDYNAYNEPTTEEYTSTDTYVPPSVDDFYVAPLEDADLAGADDGDLLDTFNELEDMLTEMANDLGVYTV